MSEPFRFFSPTSFWNKPVPADAPVDPDSERMIAALVAEVQHEEAAGTGPWIDTSEDGVPIVVASASQPTTQVALVNHPPDAALIQAWSAVPLPPNAAPSAGDGDLAVWQPSADRMWEFWHFQHSPNGPVAEWGGAMNRVSSNPGVYGPAAWPGAKPWWGVPATSFALVGGAMTIEQLEAGDIDHALAMALPHPRAGAFASPAKRTDGDWNSPSAIPEGAHLVLDPSLNLKSLNLPPLTRMIAEAAQQYGIFIRDTAGEVTFVGQTDSAGSGIYNRLFGDLFPDDLLASFPWNRLEVLKMRLHVQAS